MREFLIKVQKNIQNALKIQVAKVQRSIQNHCVVMEKFLELIAEEIKFSGNEILKDMQNQKRRPAHSTNCPLEMYWSFPD